MQLPALTALLADRGVVLLDGAQGTELERRGVHLGGSKLWSAQLLIDDPDLVRAIHLDYLRAGSDIITTFTYQASIQGFAEAGVDAAAAAVLLNRAVDLADSARAQFMQEQQQQQLQEQEQHEHEGGCAINTAAAATETQDRPAADICGSRPRPLIAYSCGSYGAYLADGSEFRGDYADSMSHQQLADFHRARLEPIRHRPEVDLLAFETVPCLKEAEAIVRLLREERYGKPAWVSFSCRDAVHTYHGESFAEQCVPLLAAAAAEGLVAAAGVNCTAPRHVAALLAAARQQLAAGCGGRGGGEEATQPQQQLLLLCYPNSGEEWDGAHRCWRHVPDDIAEPGRFAAAAAGWVGTGAVAALVGGCCRTGPEHIRALRRVLLPARGSGGAAGAERAAEAATASAANT